MTPDSSQPRTLAARVGEVALYVTLFLLPFSKAIVSIGFGVIFLAWLVARCDPRTRLATVWRLPRWRPLLVSVGVFFAICVLSLAVSDFPALTLRGVFGKWLRSLGFLIILADTVTTSAVVKRSACMVVWSSLAVLVEALTQELWGRGLFHKYLLVTYGRMTGPYDNPIDLATFLMVAILFLMAYVMIQRPQHRIMLWGLLLLMLLCFGRTLAVGPWLGFGLALLIFLVAGPRPRRYALVVLGLGIGCMGFFLSRVGGPHAIVRMQDVGAVDRVFMWQAAGKMIQDRPVLGHGINTFMANYLKYWVGGERQPRYAHNCYLQMAAETGVVGLGAFLCLLVLLLVRVLMALRRDHASEGGVLLVGLAAGLAAFLIHSAVDTNFYSLRQAGLFWILAGVAVGLSETIFSSPPRASGQPDTVPVKGGVA